MTCTNCGGKTWSQNWIPQNWSNQPLVVYHGTLEVHVAAILSSVQVSAGTCFKDFGQGFYTTTVLQQAITWAQEKAVRSNLRNAKPAVLELRVNRNKLADLSSLMFVRGHFNAEEYWSFVWHCRNSKNPQHHFYKASAASSYRMYDLVAGPIQTIWKQRIAAYDADQISFHTAKAEGLLNDRFHTNIRQIHENPPQL